MRSQLVRFEDVVSGRRPGDLPTDPADEQARTHTVRFEEVTAAHYARLRQARQRMNDEHRKHLADTDVIAVLVDLGVIGGGAAKRKSKSD